METATRRRITRNSCSQKSRPREHATVSSRLHEEETTATMGVSVSRQTELSENPLLQRFVGKEPIPASDEAFWTEFLQYQIVLPDDR